jgi:sugar phosphate isomerase/epimerase
MRLSQAAAEQLRRPAELAAFQSILADGDLYVFTINGFPYGRFHEKRVKESVYLPDWRDERRTAYSNALADILAALLPEGVTGSISTVPGSYRAWIESAADIARMAGQLANAVAHLARLRDRTGKHVELCLEPEPDCFLQATEETIAAFNELLIPQGAAHLRGVLGCDAARAEELIRRHLGVCFDTCHIALQYEELDRSLRRLVAAGLRVSKIQLSAALRMQATHAAREQLRAFDEPTYLHQVKARSRTGKVRGYADLPEALRATDGADDDEWRVHFHVPLYFEGTGELRSTGASLTPAFFQAIRDTHIGHLEVETYTFGVLPESLRSMPVTESIARELRWAMDRLR